VSLSLYGFVKSREPVSAEEVARDYLALAGANGDARKLVERVIPADSGLWWENGYLRTVDPASLPLNDTPYVVFDVETTGSSAKEGGITELGAVKVWGGEIVEELSTLVNPGRPIQPFVVKLTGITDEMVAEAPTPEEVMPRFEEFAEGCVLVGHNVSFDQGFVDAARESCGMPPVTNTVLDTLKLARLMVPGLKRYRLSSLVEHFDIGASPNHRALADAEATAGVLGKLLKMLDSQGIKSAGEAATLRRTSKKRPKPQKQHLAEEVPETPGVYYFVDGDGTVLYVGKAKNLKNRVRTYFSGGDGRRKVGRLVQETAEVRYEETGSELYALILEAREIRRLLPRFNAVGRGEEKSWFIKLSLEEPYPMPERVAADDGTPGEAIFVGPYRSARMLGVCIEALGRIFPIRRCSGHDVARNGPCFYGQMGRCAPCLGMSEEEYRRTVVDGIATLLRGEGGEDHLRALVAERERLAGELEFEAAARLRDLISGIERARLARAMMSSVGSGGPQAVVAPSTEPGVMEVFVISGGRLIGHRGFEEGDEAGLSEFASESLAGRGGIPGESAGADEARVVSSYLRRSRSATVVEAVALDSPGDLVRTVRKVREASEDSGDAGVDDAKNGTDEAI
jgi:DNA polymerase-3 subunit epsilon